MPLGGMVSRWPWRKARIAKAPEKPTCFPSLLVPNIHPIGVAGNTFGHRSRTPELPHSGDSKGVAHYRTTRRAADRCGLQVSVGKGIAAETRPHKLESSACKKTQRL